MSREEVTTTVTKGIAVVTLNRPERRNAFTRHTAATFCDTIDALDCDDDVRALIVTGSGSTFSAGADLSAGGDTFNRAAASAENQRDYGGIIALRLFSCTKPVIGAVNGDAAGLGATMTLPMDVRIAAESARFVFPFTRRGIVPEACSTWFLPRLVGVSAALEWTLGGAPVSAGDAQLAGLVRTVCPAGDLMDNALQIARDLTELSSPLSVAATRQMLWQGLTLTHPMDAHRRETELVRHLGQGADAFEGVSSFLEKRAPQFSSRPSRDLSPFTQWWAMPDYDQE